MQCRVQGFAVVDARSGKNFMYSKDLEKDELSGTNTLCESVEPLASLGGTRGYRATS